MGRFITGLILILSFTACGAGPEDFKKIVLDDGLECYIPVKRLPKTLECNFEKYNHDTHFGQYPYAIDEETNVENNP